MHYALSSLLALSCLSLIGVLLIVGIALLEDQFPGIFPPSVIRASEQLVRWCLFAMLVSALCFTIAGLVQLIGGGISAL